MGAPNLLTAFLFAIFTLISVSTAAANLNGEPYVNLCENEDYGKVPVLPALPAPDNFFVTFGTNVSTINDEYIPITMEVRRDWAPKGVDRFFALLQDHYYDNAGFFRVVPDFVIQWGIAASPQETSKWDVPITDDPVVMSNLAWTVSYATAGPDTRTSEIFINLKNNSGLDSQGFAPFARVIAGFDTVLNLTNPTPGSSDGINQTAYTLYGNVWLEQNFPNTSIVTCARLDVIPSDEAYDDDDGDMETTFTIIGLVIGIIVFVAAVVASYHYYHTGSIMGRQHATLTGPLITGDDTENPMQR